MLAECVRSPDSESSSESSRGSEDREGAKKARRPGVIKLRRQSVEASDGEQPHVGREEEVKQELVIGMGENESMN